MRSRVSIDLVAEVSGRITRVSGEFMEGGTIVPGATLVQIEPRDYELALNQAEAQVAAAQVAVELAVAEADVARKQLAGTANPSNLALKKPQVAEAKARLKAAEADLEQARINLERTHVSLPFGGRLERTYVDLGQYVTAGTPLCRAFATDKVEIRLPITYDQLSALGIPIGFVAEPGQGLAVYFTAKVGGREQKWQGELLRLDASIDSDTRTLYAIAEVNDPYGLSASESGMPLAVGLYVTAKIRGREIDDAVKIPRKALRAGDTLYVLNAQGQLEIRRVSVTHSTPEFAVIANGLRPGEQVITSTIRNPIPGMSLEAQTSNTSVIVSAQPPGNGSG